jgi:3-oxoacyl-[acyl-carrier-protein] synthase-1
VETEIRDDVMEGTGQVFIVADNIVSPLGNTTAQNFEQLKNGVSGIARHDDAGLLDQPFYASLFGTDNFSANEEHTKFEQLLIASITGALNNTDLDITGKDTILIISTTKGNISLLENGGVTEQLSNRIALTASAKLIAKQFGVINQPLVVSHACISGLVSLITGMRLIRSGQYKNAVVAGADVISKFVLSGFQSFQAISAAPCKPFDSSRDGINLGEGAGTVILSSDSKYKDNISLTAGSVTNDANHISGPSRTGEELHHAIEVAMQGAGVKAADIGFISAHGTATIYNDEMEAKAITLSGMEGIPVNSLKGFYGHTLGASGLIETIISAQSLKQGVIIPTKGFIKQGYVNPLNIYSKLQKGEWNNCLKIASGFGGCNAAIVLKK